MSWLTVTHIWNVLSLVFYLHRLILVRKRCICGAHPWEFSIIKQKQAYCETHLCLWPYKPQLKSCCYLLLGIQNHRKKFCFYIAASCVSLGVYTSRRDWNSKSMFFCSILVIKWWNMIFLEDKDVLKNISIYQHFKMKLKISHRKK